MAEKETPAAVNPEEINLSERETPPDEPHFDSGAMRGARPAVPLSRLRDRQSWPPRWMIIAGVLIGLALGAESAYLLALHAERQKAQTQTAQQQSRPAVEQPAQNASEANTSAQTTQTNGAEGMVNPVTGAREAGEKQSVDKSSVEERERAFAGSDTEAGLDDAKSSLRSALNDWVEATNARDVNRQMSFYQQKVNAFYLTRNVSREAVRAEKARVLGSAEIVDIRVGNPEIKLSQDGRTATMRFRKRYNIAGGGQDRSGEVVQELRWRREGGKWNIVSERDLKVLP
ncbi:MAG TPA: nuclear transport factor 2 family protein [Pyrinomonadaceae bacterium]|jgi:ketosteroid isomerase-like protein